MPWNPNTSTRATRLPRGWAKLRRHVMDRDGWTCCIAGPGCTIRATECDHIVRGDNHHPSNLQAACKHCHTAKSAQENHATRPRRTRPAEPHPGLIDRPVGVGGTPAPTHPNDLNV